MKASEVIELLGLAPLPQEGGFFRQTFKDKGVIEESCSETGQQKSFSTCIYYLVTPESFSSLHGVKSNEIFHFYAGDPVRMIQISKTGELKEVILGSRLKEGHQPQVLVPKDTWQGTKLLDGGKWALMGCTVAPGFEYADYILSTRSELLESFPMHEKNIVAYTRPDNNL